MKVLLSPMAEAYVKEEILYLRARNRDAAHRFVLSLRQLTDELARFPEMGNPHPDLPFETIHRFVMGSYLVDYERRDGAIHILRIRHGRQQPLPLPIEADQDFEA